MGHNDKMYLLTLKFCPSEGLFTPAPVLYKTMEKVVKKLQFKELFFFNLHHLVIVTNGFIWYKNSVKQGLSAPAPGIYTCMKLWKKCIKSQFKEIFMKLILTGNSDKKFYLTL